MFSKLIVCTRPPACLCNVELTKPLQKNHDIFYNWLIKRINISWIFKIIDSLTEKTLHIYANRARKSRCTLKWRARITYFKKYICTKAHPLHIGVVLREHSHMTSDVFGSFLTYLPTLIRYRHFTPKRPCNNNVTPFFQFYDPLVLFLPHIAYVFC